jgi:flagellin
MAIYIQTNMTALNTARHLNSADKMSKQTTSRIASGRRINSAADDAANSGVSTNLVANSRSSKQAVKNINDGISMLNVAEQGTNSAANSIKRMRELAIMGSSETLASNERQYIQAEYEALVETVDDIANNTLFNSKQLIDGNSPTIGVQAGINGSTNDLITLSMGDISVHTIGIDTGSIDMSTLTGARDAIGKLDLALNSLNGYRSEYGAKGRALDSAISSMEIYDEAMIGAASRLMDADYAYETSELSKFSIMTQAGTSILAQGSQLSQGVMSLL